MSAYNAVPKTFPLEVWWPGVAGGINGHQTIIFSAAGLRPPVTPLYLPSLRGLTPSQDVLPL